MIDTIDNNTADIVNNTEPVKKGKIKLGLTADEAKEEIIKLLGQGYQVVKACEMVDKSTKAYEYYRKTDPDFKRKADQAKIMAKRGVGEVRAPQNVPDFPTFCEKYMKQKLYLHQLQWYDMLEGREPRELHPSMEYNKGSNTQRLVINTPPNHAKSTTVTVNYVVYRIIQNPSIRIIIISKSQEKAKEFLLQIKERLTDSQYDALQLDFAPAGGWKEGSSSWKADRFYVGGRNTEAKDPTVQAAGIRGQINGARADLIILDDAVDNLNFGEFEKQISWTLQVVNSRLTPRTGRCIIIGTRFASRDLYNEIQDSNRYIGGSSPWSYLRQPAVLEFAEKPEDWVTLWPFSDSPADIEEEPTSEGVYRRWDGLTLNQVRNDLTPDLWSRTYQQEQVIDNGVFKVDRVLAACDGRAPGLIPDSESFGRAGGMNGLHIIAGLDPAAAGYTACVVYGIDAKTARRWVVDLHNQKDMQPDEVKDLIRNMTVKYNIREWRIEKNAFQRWLTRDTDINQWLGARGVILTEHETGDNKNDPDFGVMAMGALFDNGLIHLPNNGKSVAVKTLIDQLTVWHPKPPKSMKTDLVMALWFAELRALEIIVKGERSNYYRDNRLFTTKSEKAERRVIFNEDYNPNGSVASQGSYYRDWLGK